jgi:hypothetical protein
MANITNKHSAPLGLPNGVVIPDGRTVSVDNWDSIKGHPVVQAWLDANALVVEGAPPEEGGDPLDSMTKAELVAEADRRGVTIDPSATKAEILAALKAAEGA